MYGTSTSEAPAGVQMEGRRITAQRHAGYYLSQKSGRGCMGNSVRLRIDGTWHSEIYQHEFFRLVRIGFVTLHHFREFVMKWQAIILTKSYNIIRLIPRWALYSDWLPGQPHLKLVHRRGTTETTKVDPVPQSTIAGSSTT